MRGPAGAEGGSSPITATFSVGVFLLFLLLSAQVLLHLHTATVVAGAAHDAVAVAAGAATGTPDGPVARAAGEERARQLLGGLVGPDGGAPDLAWQVASRAGGSRELVLTITVASPSVAVRGTLLGAVERSAAATVEEVAP